VNESDREREGVRGRVGGREMDGGRGRRMDRGRWWGHLGVREGEGELKSDVEKCDGGVS